MRAAAGRRAQEFSWERAAATYAACYRHAAGRRLTEAQEAARQRYAIYQQLAGITVPQPVVTADESASPSPEDEE